MRVANIRTTFPTVYADLAANGVVYATIKCMAEDDDQYNATIKCMAEEK